MATGCVSGASVANLIRVVMNKDYLFAHSIRVTIMIFAYNKKIISIFELNLNLSLITAITHTMIIILFNFKSLSMLSFYYVIFV